MSELALAAQWALAAVLLVSGVAKLADRSRTADAVVGFGVPEQLRWAAPIVPVIELALAAMLVVSATARWGALGAAALLAVFSIAVVVNLARGRRPACNCFGRLDAGPIGGRTLVRNAALIGVAVVAAQRDAATIGDVVSGVTVPVALALVAGLVAAAALAGLTWLVTELWRQQARLLERIDALETGRPTAGPPQHPHGPSAAGPPVGRAAPDPQVHDAEGSAVSLSQHWSAGRDTLVVFGDPDCPACTKIQPEIVAWRDERPAHRHVIVVSRSASTPVPSGATLLVEQDRAASKEYSVQGTPSAVLVAGDGTVASPLAEGAEAVRALLAEPPQVAAGERAPVRFVTRPASAGQMLPEVDLPPVDDATLLVFWNEGCGHCRGMTAGLQERTAGVDPRRPRLTFVVPTPAQASAVRDRLPSATTLVDAEMRVNLALGVPGTPSAALVGRDRRLVADLAVGPDAVFALLDR